ARSNSVAASATSSTMTRALLRYRFDTTGPNEVVIGASPKPTASAASIRRRHSSCGAKSRTTHTRSLIKSSRCTDTSSLDDRAGFVYARVGALFRDTPALAGDRSEDKPRGCIPWAWCSQRHPQFPGEVAGTAEVQFRPVVERRVDHLRQPGRDRRLPLADR